MSSCFFLQINSLHIGFRWNLSCRLDLVEDGSGFVVVPLVLIQAPARPLQVHSWHLGKGGGEGSLSGRVNISRGRRRRRLVQARHRALVWGERLLGFGGGRVAHVQGFIDNAETSSSRYNNETSKKKIILKCFYLKKRSKHLITTDTNPNLAWYFRIFSKITLIVEKSC